MASWQGRAVRAAQPATLAGPLLALLVLLACSSEAKAEQTPQTDFDNLDGYIKDSMAEAYQLQQNYEQMARRVQGKFEEPDVYAGGSEAEQRFAAVCYNHTGEGGVSGNEPYEQGEKFGGDLGYCDNEVPPHAACWSAGGAVHVEYKPPDSVTICHRVVPLDRPPPQALCAVFFWPPAEATATDPAALAHQGSIVRLAGSCSQELIAAGDGDGGQVPVLLDLSKLAKCIVTELWEDLEANRAGFRDHPRAALVVADDARPGHALPHGHVFKERVNLFAEDPQRAAIPVTGFVLGPAPF